MNRLNNRRFALAYLAVALVSLDGRAQEASLIPPFPTAVISRLWDDKGDLTATHTHTGDELAITVKKTRAGQVEGGWAGVCVQNSKPVNLQNFTHATAQVESSARVTMDVKLEKSKFQEGTILLTDHGPVGTARTTLEWNLKTSDEVTGGGTLAETRRMCFYVLADGFPARQNEVVVKISRIRFDRRSLK
ncbi:MAG: hypothetical protein WC815_20170 [Vicinamibacterales bacterium]